jgi:hypothetical protein
VRNIETEKLQLKRLLAEVLLPPLIAQAVWMFEVAREIHV